MNTTVEIQDALLARAKQHAKRTQRPLRAVIEEGLRRVLAGTPKTQAYQMPDRSVGEPGVNDPLRRARGFPRRSRGLRSQAARATRVRS